MIYQNYLKKIINNKFRISLLYKLKNKEFYKLINDNKKIFAKIYLSKYTKKISLNEFDAYKYYKKKKQINIPKIIFFKKNSKFNVLLLEYIEAQSYKKNYFRLFNYYKLPGRKNSKKICLNKYLDKYFINLNNFQKNIKYKLIKKYKNKKILQTASHGDLIYYNLLTKKKINYFIDFEFFSKNRSLYFDLLNWFIVPIITTLIRYKISKLIILFPIFFLKIIFYFIKKNITIKNFSIFKMYFNIFLFEKLILMENVFLENKYVNKKDKLRNQIINILKKILLTV